MKGCGSVEDGSLDSSEEVVLSDEPRVVETVSVSSVVGTKGSTEVSSVASVVKETVSEVTEEVVSTSVAASVVPGSLVVTLTSLELVSSLLVVASVVVVVVATELAGVVSREGEVGKVTGAGRSVVGEEVTGESVSKEIVVMLGSVD